MKSRYPRKINFLSLKDPKKNQRCEFPAAMTKLFKLQRQQLEEMINFDVTVRSHLQPFGDPSLPSNLRKLKTKEILQIISNIYSEINITSKQQRKLIKTYRAVLQINFERKTSNKKRLAYSSVTLKLKNTKTCSRLSSQPLLPIAGPNVREVKKNKRRIDFEVM